MFSCKCTLLHGTSVYFCIFLHYEYAKSNLSRRRETLLFPSSLPLTRARAHSFVRSFARSLLFPIRFCAFFLPSSSSTSNNIIEKKGAQCHLVISLELFPVKHETDCLIWQFQSGHIAWFSISSHLTLVFNASKSTYVWFSCSSSNWHSILDNYCYSTRSLLVFESLKKANLSEYYLFIRQMSSNTG